MSSRWSINITPAERAARIIIGGAGAVVGIVLLVGATSTFSIAVELLLVLAGLDLVVTGALGHCPLYAKLGHVPTSLKGRTS
jgi:Inner membrane protein YgaP-like, transmembrane domain